MTKEQLFYQAVNHPDEFARDILLYSIQNSKLEGFEEYSLVDNLEEQKYKLDLTLEKEGL